MGDYDYMGQVYQHIHAEVVFWKTLIRPGMPVLFGMWKGKPIFSLAGNPASSFVNAWLFLLPAIRYMAGIEEPLSATLLAKTTDEIPAKMIPHTRFLRGSVYEHEGQLWVQPAKNQSSSVLSSFLGSNGFLKVPGGQGYQAGELVEIEMYGDIVHAGVHVKRK